MAYLAYIKYVPHVCLIEYNNIQYKKLDRTKKIIKIPTIFWSSNTPWEEANLWAFERIINNEVSASTVESNMRGLQHYAKFLEDNSIDWLYFPIKKSDRCIYKYRRYLKECIDNSSLAGSTASSRIRNVVFFYRWLISNGLLSDKYELWTNKKVYINYFDKVGFQRTIRKESTDLSIPNRLSNRFKLEDGLLPVSVEDRNEIINFAKNNSSQELYLLLLCGFFTGMRLGTLCDLKVSTLDQAASDCIDKRLFKINIGPAASPAVHTKNGVTGQVSIPEELMIQLTDYCHSVRRLERRSKALPENKDLIFFTRFGNPYGRKNTDRSSAVNVEMFTLRKKAKLAGITSLMNFNFHMSRCTFGTELARIALEVGETISAIAFVKEALLHKDESTTIKYIKFIKDTPIKSSIANSFTNSMFGQGEI